jgi:hypothetical protein
MVSTKGKALAYVNYQESSVFFLSYSHSYGGFNRFKISTIFYLPSLVCEKRRKIEINQFKL